jgi:serine/threonine protein phosphatase PrpC
MSSKALNLQTTEFRTDQPFQFDETPTVSASVKLDIGAASHPGKLRPQNEDAFIIYQTGRYWEHLQSSLEPGEIPDRVDEKSYVMAVADGIGGRKGGEVASNLALRIIVSLILKTGKYAAKLDNPETREQEIEGAMKRAQDFFQRADQELLKYAEHYPSLKGMGTTLTSAYVFGKDLFTMHVGDSRAYLFRGGKLYKLTKDQTFAQALVDAGTLTPEQGERHYFRHTLTSCLGGKGGKVDLEIQHHELFNQDKVMVCTDGLTEMVSESEITEIFSSKQSAQVLSDQLLKKALDAGGRDNITVIVANYSL